MSAFQHGDLLYHEDIALYGASGPDVLADVVVGGLSAFTEILNGGVGLCQDSYTPAGGSEG